MALTVLAWAGTILLIIAASAICLALVVAVAKTIKEPHPDKALKDSYPRKGGYQSTTPVSFHLPLVPPGPAPGANLAVENTEEWQAFRDAVRSFDTYPKYQGKKESE